MSAPPDESGSTYGSSSQLSAPSSSASRRGRGGRKGADVRASEFKTLEFSSSSKRSGAECKHCGEKWSAAQAHAKTLLQHIVEKCPEVPDECRSSWQAAALWGMGVEGADLLNPAYHEALLSGPRRIISTPAVGVDPTVIAAQFIAQHQAEQAAAAAAAQAMQAAAATMGMVPPPGMGMIPTPGLPPAARQELQRQSALLAGMQQR